MLKTKLDKIRLRKGWQARFKLRKLEPIVAEMLDYERDQFETEPQDWWVDYQVGKEWFTSGPFATESEAQTIAIANAGTVRPEDGNVYVNGPDLVDHFTDWREKLKEAIR